MTRTISAGQSTTLQSLVDSRAAAAPVDTSQSASGNSPSVHAPLGVSYVNKVYVSDDKVNPPDNAPVVTGLVVDHRFGGAGATGGRAAFASVATLRATPDVKGDPYYVANWAWARAQVNAGGTGSGDWRGNVCAANPQVTLYGAATNYSVAVGMEVDVGCLAGSSTKNKIGINITTIGNDAVAGEVVDAALQFGAVVGSPKWTDAILFSKRNGTSALHSGGYVMRSHEALSCKAGIDFSNFTFSDYAFKSTGFAVDGLGNLTAKTLTFAPAASATPANNGEVTFELTSNTSLKIKAKGSDGVVRSTTLALA